MSPSADPLDLSLRALVAALAAGRLSATGVAEAVIARAGERADLHAFITTPDEALLAAAAAADRRRPLAGAPIAVKDNIDTADAITTAGAPGLIDWRPTRDADVVRRLRETGGLVAGKTNLHELAGGMTSANATFGAVANPYDPRCHGGGSSGGSAAAVAARIVPAALGSDTGGSVISPAAMCGIWGFRPTVGRVSQRGLVPMSSTRDTIGWLARDPDDLILMDRLLADAPADCGPPAISGLRIGVPRAFFQDGLEADVAAVFAEARARLSRAGAILVEADLPGLPGLADCGTAIILHERPRELAMYLASHGAKRTVLDVFDAATTSFSRGFRERLAKGEELAAADYRRALMQDLARLQRAYADYFTKHDLIAMLTPAAQMTSKPVSAQDTVSVNGRAERTLTYARFTMPPTTAQLPALSVPVALAPSGLPVGVFFVGPSMSDGRLLGLGAALAKVFPPLPAPM